MHRVFSRLALIILASCASPGVLAAQTATVRTPPTNDVAALALSPDGLTLALVSRHNGRNHLWLQPVGGGAARVLAGTADAVHPFWSPDGSRLAFFGDDEMRQVDIRTGQVSTILTQVTFPAGGSWSKNGTILFSTHGRYMIWRIPETGGTPAIVVPLDGPDQYALVHPHFLPDGENFLYYTQGKPHERGIYQGVLGSNLTRRVVESEAGGVYAAGKLFYVKDGTLYARAFDELLGVLGEKTETIARDVPMGGRSIAGLASNGRQVVYRKGSAGGARQLTWYDRAGKKLGTVGEPFYAANSAPSMSPDGKALVLNHMVGGTGDVAIVDLATGKMTPVSDDPATDLSPLWSSDGAHILFSSKRTVTIEMYRQKVGAPMAPEKVFPQMGLRHPMDMTRDGRYLFYRMNMPDLWALDQKTGAEISIIPAGASRVQWPQVSPDGRWIAFQSNLTGTTQVHVHGPFAPPSLGATSKPLSVNGGGWVRWSGNGKELFYTEADGTVMSVPLEFSSDGSSFTAAAPVRLFTAPMNASHENSGIAQQYLVTPDARRFLVVAAPDEDSPVYLHAP